MITLTSEQAQQIEEALQGVVNCPQEDAYWLFSIGESLATIRAARANFQSETSIENNPADSFKANYPVAWKCLCGANLYIDSDGSPASKAEPAEQPVSQEYQDHLVNQSFDWAAMAAKHQFMEGYRIGLAEMREKCAKVCDEWNWSSKHGSNPSGQLAVLAAAIRAIKFEGDTGFRPVSEMVAEHKQDPEKAAAIEKAKMRKAEQEPVAWYLDTFDEDGELDYREYNSSNKFSCGWGNGTPLYAAPVRTKDLTDDEIMDLVRDECVDMRWPSTPLFIARAVIAKFKEKNK